MKPIGIETKRGEYRIQHVCQSCGFRRTTRAATSDSMGAIIEVSTQAFPL